MSKLESILSYLATEGTKTATELATKFGLAKSTVERYMRRPEVRMFPGFAMSKTDEGLSYTYVKPQENTKIKVEITTLIDKTPVSELSLIREFGKAQVELATDALIELGEINELVTIAGNKWFVRLEPTSDYLEFKGSVFKRDGQTWEELAENVVTSTKWELI